MELVPHITLNPSFNIDMLEYIEAEASPTDACERERQKLGRRKLASFIFPRKIFVCAFISL